MRRFAFCILVLAGAVFSATALEVTPGSVCFRAVGQSEVLRFTHDGQPVAPGAIQSWQLRASGHDYAFMLDYGKTKDGLRITATDRTEVGTYTLAVHTAHGDVTVEILAPLSEMASIVERRAKATGQSIDAVKEELGLASAGPRPRIHFELPPVYYEGQVLEMTMPAEEGTRCRWLVNGAAVAEGEGGTPLRYAFPEPGDYLVRYEERKDGQCIAAASALTTAAALPPVPWEVPPHAALDVPGPEGYAAYAWTLDGEDAGTGKHFTHTFAQPGAHTLVCKATGPEGGHPDAFYRITYAITVAP